jgi:subfamily B ATP-binding cassette protein MsbA
LKEAKTLRLLLPLLRGFAWGLPSVIVLGILSSLAESIGLSLFVPLLQSLDRGSYHADGPDKLQSFFAFVLKRLPAGNEIVYIASLILLMTVGKALLTYAHSTLVGNMNARVTHSLRSRIFSKAIAISQQHLDETGSGRLINLLATDTWHTSDAISTFVGLVVNLCSILVFGALLVALSWKLTVIVAAGVILVSLLLRIVTRSAHRLGEESLRANTVLSNHMLDALEGIREIQMFSLARHLQRRFDAASDRVRSIFLRLDLLHKSVPPLSEILYVTLLILLLLIGVRNGISTPTMIVFLLVLYRLQPQIRQVDSARLSLVALTTPVDEVTKFLGTGVPEPRAAIVSSNSFTRELTFDRLGFTYGADLVLNDISFSIPFGKTTAIVGPSGSGKSTLVSLLCRFYEPTLGAIRVDGTKLHDLDVEQWRNNIAWVSQDAYIFSASVADNIRYGRIDATDEEVRAAAIQANADYFIRNLPNGYSTEIGNGGTRLSSGQVQRIALARAFVRQPRLLLLDEATNALDSVAEEIIRPALQQGTGERTLVIVSHRLSTVRHADQVIVLSKGRIAQMGTPRELLAKQGLFRTLRELQHVD